MNARDASPYPFPIAFPICYLDAMNYFDSSKNRARLIRFTQIVNKRVSHFRGVHFFALLSMALFRSSLVTIIRSLNGFKLENTRETRE